MSSRIRRGLGKLVEELSVYSQRADHLDELIDATLTELRALSLEEITAPPLLVFEVLCTLYPEVSTFSANPRRERSHALKRVYVELRASLSLNQLTDEVRRTALKTLFFYAPSRLAIDQVIRVERATLLEGPSGIDSKEREAATQWALWRSAAESLLVDRLWYSWHLMCSSLRSGRLLCLPLIDQGALRIRRMTRDERAELQIKAKAGKGGDDQRYRFPQGSFHEVRSDALPADPARILACDLALFAEEAKAARAVLLAKISDAELSVRFGEVPRPSKRRARVRVIIALRDLFDHHVYYPNTREPMVDILRRAISHLIPSILSAISSAEVDGEVTLLRDGVGGRGQARLGSVDATSTGLPKFTSSRSTMITLMEGSKWFVEDDLGGSADLQGGGVVRPPETQMSVDELIVIWHGAKPLWVSEYDVYQELGFELGRDEAKLLTRERGDLLRTRDVSAQALEAQSWSARSIARLLVNQLDLDVQGDERGRGNTWGGTSI